MGKIPSLSECNPGGYPVEFNVVIAPEEVEEVTKAGIIIPGMAKEKEDAASMRGRLISASPLAFNYDTWPDGSRKPQPGDVVLFAKYAGVLFKGADEREYRACKDKDLIMVLTGPEGQ